jgi:hypothetical protein
MSLQTPIAALAAFLLISSTISGTAQNASRTADPSPTEIVRSMVQDPAIKDFVGIAENTWDFSKPGGVPGSEPQAAVEASR